MRWHVVVGSLLAVALLWSGPLQAAESPAEEKPVGATVEEWLDLARRMSPERTAAALEADAAAARADGAGTLPDPKFTITLDDISKNRNGLPGRVAVEKYTLQQELPWWGKRDLQRGMAEAESRETKGKLAEVEADIALRIKTAYADYHRVHLSMDQTNELIQIMRTLVKIAQLRYAQGMAGQLEATSAEAERGSLDVELVRLGKERSRIRARLNALVNRKPDAPVVEHPHLRSLPTRETLNDSALLEKALERNPEEQNGFEAMVEFNLPIQWQGRRAREQETSAKVRANREQLAAEQLRVDASLRETLLALEEAQEVAHVTTETLLPQTRLALQSAIKGYQTGNTESVAVLDAVQRLKKFQIDLLKAQFEAQVRLAELERLIGGEL